MRAPSSAGAAPWPTYRPERDVLRMVVDGKENAAIARELFVSPATVKNHVSNILAKLGAENRLQAAVRAVRDSLV